MSDLIAERAVLLRQVAELQAEVEALRADAKRYQALRSRTLGAVPMARVQWMFRGQYSIKKGAELDAAIDAARKEG